MLNIVLVEPEIPANTGNIGRTCVVTGSALHIVGPTEMHFDDKSLKRSGMGYWKSLDLHMYENWDEFVEKTKVYETPEKLHLLTKKAKRTYVESHYSDGDYLVFGKESSGLSEELLAAHAESCERIPMLNDEKALKNADSWDSGEARSHTALKQQDIAGNFIDPEDYRISALNLSNSAAIVVYEALRQLNFPNME